MLAVEVANTSLEYDRKVKLALYARGGLAALDALERAGWDVFSGRPAPSKWTFAGLALRELFRP